MPTITLTVAGQEFDLLALNYRFHQDVDLKGRPETPFRDGMLYMVLESTENNYFFEQFVTKELNTKPFAGKIEVQMYWDEMAVRRLVWTEAYIIRLSERMDCYSTEPMTMELVISPINLTIDNRVYLTRQQPKTSGFWQIDPEPEMTPMRSPDVLSYAATPKKPKVLVTAVKGKDNAYPNEKVTYTVTSYSSAPTDTDRKRVSWVMQVDGKRKSISQKGEEIVLKMKEDWAGKEITVMAYLETPLESVSQNTKIIQEAVIILVNGHWNKIVNKAGWAPGSGGKGYWDFFTNTSSFVNEAESYFDDPDSTFRDPIYVDGSSLIGIDQSGSDRKKKGYKYAQENYGNLTNNGKTTRFYFISHSEGSAYSAGIAAFLSSQGDNVCESIMLSADEGDEFSVGGYPCYQIVAGFLSKYKKIKNKDLMQFNIDPVVKDHRVSGITKYGVFINNNEFGTVHGSTISSKSFGILKKLKSVRAVQSFTRKGNIVYIAEPDSDKIWHRIDNYSIDNERIDVSFPKGKLKLRDDLEL